MGQMRGIMRGVIAVGFVLGVAATIGIARHHTDPTIAAAAPAPGITCDSPYDRQEAYGKVPTVKARQAVIRAATSSTGQVIDYYTGQPLSLGASPDVDHIYALATAWPVACGWTAEQRHQFANDVNNMRPTSAHINRSKSDQTPAQWVPVNRERACDYTTVFLAVAVQYGLPVSDGDRHAHESACAAG